MFDDLLARYPTSSAIRASRPGSTARRSLELGIAPAARSLVERAQVCHQTIDVIANTMGIVLRGAR